MYWGLGTHFEELHPMTMSDLQLTLARLGFDSTGEVFWLTTTPEITDEELMLRVSCL